MKTAGWWSWKLKSSYACVITHRFNYLALKIDDFKAF